MGNCLPKKKKQEAGVEAGSGSGGGGKGEPREVPLAEMPARPASPAAGTEMPESVDIADLGPPRQSTAMERLEQRLTMSSRASVYRSDGLGGGGDFGDGGSNDGDNGASISGGALFFFFFFFFFFFLLHDNNFFFLLKLFFHFPCLLVVSITYFCCPLNYFFNVY
jgi:hypothetical protein